MLSVHLIALAAITVSGGGQAGAPQTASQKKELEAVASFLTAQMRLEYAVGSLEEDSAAFTAATKAYDDATKSFLASQSPIHEWLAEDKKVFCESAFQCATALSQLVEAKSASKEAMEVWKKLGLDSDAGRQAYDNSRRASRKAPDARDEFYSRCWRVLENWREQESPFRDVVETTLPAPTYYYVRERLNTFIDFRQEETSTGSTFLPDPAWPTRCVLQSPLMPAGWWHLANARWHDVFVQNPDKATTALLDQFIEASYIAKRGDTVFAVRKLDQEWVDVENWRQLADTARKLSGGVQKTRVEVLVGRTRDSAKTFPVWFVLKPLRSPFLNPWKN